MASSVWATSPYRTQLDAQVAADLGSISAFQGLRQTANTLLRVLPATAPETCKAFLKLFESEKENDWIKWAVSLRDRSIGEIITRARRHPECSCLLVPFLARLLKWRRRKEGLRWSLTDEGYSFVDDDIRKMLDRACLCVCKDKRVAKEFGKVGTYILPPARNQFHFSSLSMIKSWCFFLCWDAQAAAKAARRFNRIRHAWMIAVVRSMAARSAAVASSAVA